MSKVNLKTAHDTLVQIKKNSVFVSEGKLEYKRVVANDVPTHILRIEFNDRRTGVLGVIIINEYDSLMQFDFRTPAGWNISEIGRPAEPLLMRYADKLVQDMVGHQKKIKDDEYEKIRPFLDKIEGLLKGEVYEDN